MNKNIIFLGDLHFNLADEAKVTNIRIQGQLARTWKRKFELIKHKINNSEIDGLIIYLPTPIFPQITKPEFSELWYDLLPHLHKTSVVVVVYEQNLLGNFDFYDYGLSKYLSMEDINYRLNKIEEERVWIESNLDEDTERTQESEFHNTDIDTPSLVFYLEAARERLEDYRARKSDYDKFTNSLLSDDFSLITFHKKKEVEFRIKQFVSDIVRDSIFEIYIRRSDFLSEEFDDLLNIFQKYMQDIENINLQVDKVNSDFGIIYKFRSRELKSNADITAGFNRFGAFIEEYQKHPESVLETLKKSNVNYEIIIDAIENINKKYKRLLLDLKHKQEKLELLKNQEIEGAILEIEMNSSSIALLNRTNLQLLTSSGFVNENSIPIDFSVEEGRLIEIVQKYDPDKVFTIKTDIEKTKDSSLPEVQRKSSAQKIKSYLFTLGKKAADKLEDVGIDNLIEYFEKLM